MMHGSGRGRGTGPVGRRWRRTVVVAVVSLALTLGVPAPQVLPAGSGGLSWLWDWFRLPAGWAAPGTPVTPQQESAGGAAGKAHIVTASATRAKRGTGRAPGRGAGQLPAYAPKLPVRKPARTASIPTGTVALRAATTTANQAPQVTAQYPPQNYGVPTLTPQLIAGGTDDGQPNASLQYDFWLFDSSGKQLTQVGPFATGVWQVPAGTLKWGQLYQWAVEAFDGALWSQPSPIRYFTTAVPQPPVTSKLSQNVGGRGYEPGIGNYTTSATDADVATVGPALAIQRYYNSADPRVSGAFGTGWSSVLDSRVTEQKDAGGALQSVVVTYPDGPQIGFGRNADGSFAPPLGRFATLSAVTGGYTLVDKNSTKYTFTQAAGTGIYGLTSVTDVAGRTLSFTYAGGQVTTMTSNVSASQTTPRALHLSWFTPTGAGTAHVHTVVTDPAVAGDSSTAQTWTYAYTADRLSSVCPPTSATACSGYGYTSTTQYPGTVTDLGPRSYWRLADPANSTVATSSVLANEGSDNGTYGNVALGQPGPLPGATSTAAGFTASSRSNVLLQPGVVSNASYQSISLWFKTTTADGVLFSYEADPIGNGTTPGNYVPALYVGSDGKLLGKFWTGVYSAPAMSANPVTDGHWHHVVLSGGGNTQAMYLDGVQAGTTGSGAIQLYNSNGSKNVYLGAGFIGGGWPDEPYFNSTNNTGTAEYFTGQIAEVSFYDKWLSGTQVSALYAAGHAAANVVSTSTRPSGNVAATVSYDSVTGRVAQLTDANGGVWKLGAPTVSGSSQVFATAVMGAAPADYWRLGDGSGPTAVNEVHGGTATYNTVTLGGGGPFADATAASFDGASSYLKLPNGLLPASGARSVGLWFNTTQTGAVLLSQQAQGLGGAGCPCYPALWVGSDGTLRGSVPANTPTGPMTGMANKCLDLSAFGQTDGTKVQLYTCTGAYNQVWQAWPDGTVRNPSSGKCLDISGLGTDNGTKVQLWACTGAWNQVWQPQANGTWKNPQSGRCLDLQGPSSADGTQAWIWDCYGGPGQLWKASFVSPSPVNDGKWHHAVLASDGTAQAMYVDGVLAGSSSGPALASTAQPYVYVGAGRTPDGTGTTWTGLAAGTDTYFKGSVSDVAFYRSQLTQNQVSAQFAASKSSAGLTPVQSVVVTDPAGKQLRYDYDATVGNRLIATTDGLGYTTKYGYDTGGFVNTVTDPNGNVSITGHDVRGNVVSTTTCQNLATNACSTTYYTYYPDDTTSTLTPDPRNDVLLSVRDPRSSSATDNAYLTSYTYDTSGNRTAVTTPPVPGFPNGRTTTTTYTSASTYVGAPNDCVIGIPEQPHPPAGLPATVTTPGGAGTRMCYTANGDMMATVDPAGLTTTYSHNNLGRVTTMTVTSDTFPAGLNTTYTYDGLDRVLTRTAPAVTDRVTGAVHTPKTTMVYDVDGNVTSSTVADLGGGDASRTTTATFNTHDQQITATDATGAVTSYGYDLYGNRTSVTDAAGTETDTAYDPNGHLTTTTLKGYTGDPVNPSPPKDLVRESRAYDPAGRLASVTDAMGWVTSYTYTDDGLTATVTRTDPAHGTSFVQETDSYDAAGNLITKVTNNGATKTTSTVDAADRITSTALDPAGVNRTTTLGYSPDDAVVSTQIADANGSSTTEATYDLMGRVTSRTVDGVGASPPDGWWKLTETSGTIAADSGLAHQNGTLTGGVSWSGGAASFDGSSGAIATAGSVLSTTQSFTVSVWVNLASTAHDQTVVSQDAVHNSGFVLQYDSTSNRWLFAHLGTDSPVDWSAFVESGAAPSTGSWTHLVGVYDATAQTATLYVNGAQAGTGNDPAPAPASGSLAIGRDRVSDSPNDYLQGSAANVQVYQRALSGTDVSTLFGNGRTGGALATGKLRTSWQLDKRGLPTSQTDPNGNTTLYSYDEAGKLAVTTDPVVNTETNGGTPVATHPVSMVGYDTFGEPTESSDPLGNLVTTAYDAAGRPTSVTLPSYTPPGSGTAITAVAAKAYNNLGQVVNDTDPLNHQTTYTYDQLGNRATITAPNGGVTHNTYDLLGDQLSSTDPIGAVGQATYDYLGRKVTTTQVVRQPASAAYTTTYAYNTPGGWLSSVTTPGGSATTFGYDNAGERTKVVDAANNTTLAAYDYAGRVVKTTLPDGSALTATYDAAGRQIGGAQLSPTGTVLAGTSSTFDNDGNPLTAKDAIGHTTSYSYDALNQLSTETQPVSASASITTSFGYDAAGNRTRFTDGRGNPFITTFNPWGLPESTIEPSTPAFPNAVDRTFTTAYDAVGRIATQTAPGGVSVTSTYDTIGDLTGQTGTGAEAVTTARTFGYDTDGRMTSASAPGGTDTFTLDDRGLLLSATGPSGASSFAYNGDGLMTSRIDAAGTSAYTYDTADRLRTVTDPSSGAVLTYGYNTLSQPTQIAYGSGADTRTFGYDPMHRLASDTLRTSGGATVASISYGYDANGNETSKTTTGFAGSAANTYTYDYADRLASWTAGGSTTTYAYDNSGNRTQAGSQTFAYNARNQLTTGGGSTYTYTARGTLASVGSVASTSDAFGQTITQGGQTYTDDALGRVVTDATSGGTSRTFSYTGVGNTVASDGSATYSRDPGGALVGIKAGARSLLAWTDRHTDVVGGFTTSSTSLAGSTAYDPLGRVLASNTPAGNLGYQSGWTEASSGRVNMSARWYNPASGQFDNRDSFANSPVPDGVNADRYAYANDNPLTGTDPSGHRVYDPPDESGGSSTCNSNNTCGHHDSYGDSAGHGSSGSGCGDPCRHHDSYGDSAGHKKSSGGDCGPRCHHDSYGDSAGHKKSSGGDCGPRCHHDSFPDPTPPSPGIGCTHNNGPNDCPGTPGTGLTNCTHNNGPNDCPGTPGTGLNDCTHNNGPNDCPGVPGAGPVTCPQNNSPNGCGAPPSPAAQVPAIQVPFVPTLDQLRAADPNFALGQDTALQAASVYFENWCAGYAQGDWESVKDICAQMSESFGWGKQPVLPQLLGGLLIVGALAAPYVCLLGACEAAAVAGLDCVTVTDCSSDLEAFLSDNPGAGAGNVGGLGGLGKLGAACSFDAGTQVLLSDGKTEAIADINVGDNVAATDPTAKQTTGRTVTAVHVNGDLALADVTVRDASGRKSVVHTTVNHPFWDRTRDTWIGAGALHPGDALYGFDGTAVTVVGVHSFLRPRAMYNLTIDTDHTFYVIAGTTPVLVHNEGWCGVGDLRDGASLIHYFDSPKGPVGVMANVTISGNTVTLSDIAVYGEGIPRGGLGLEGTALILHEVRKNVLPALSEQGFSGGTLVITGVRLSGPVGHSPDLTFAIP
jgi:large repetitive protein